MNSPLRAQKNLANFPQIDPPKYKSALSLNREVWLQLATLQSLEKNWNEQEENKQWVNIFWDMVGKENKWNKTGASSFWSYQFNISLEIIVMVYECPLLRQYFPSIFLSLLWLNCHSWLFYLFLKNSGCSTLCQYGILAVCSPQEPLKI